MIEALSRLCFTFCFLSDHWRARELSLSKRVDFRSLSRLEIQRRLWPHEFIQSSMEWQLKLASPRFRGVQLVYNFVQRSLPPNSSISNNKQASATLSLEEVWWRAVVYFIIFDRNTNFQLAWIVFRWSAIVSSHDKKQLSARLIA